MRRAADSSVAPEDAQQINPVPATHPVDHTTVASSDEQPVQRDHGVGGQGLRWLSDHALKRTCRDQNQGASATFESKRILSGR